MKPDTKAKPAAPAKESVVPAKTVPDPDAPVSKAEARAAAGLHARRLYHEAPLVGGALAGAATGALVGAIAGPPGAIVGAVVGAAVGGGAGRAMENADEDEGLHVDKLDDELGLHGGPMGAASSRPPPSPSGAGSSGSSRIAPSSEGLPAEDLLKLLEEK
jgi:Glycine zipper